MAKKAWEQDVWHVICGMHWGFLQLPGPAHSCTQAAQTLQEALRSSRPGCALRARDRGAPRETWQTQLALPGQGEGEEPGVWWEGAHLTQQAGSGTTNGEKKESSCLKVA